MESSELRVMNEFVLIESALQCIFQETLRTRCVATDVRDHRFVIKKSRIRRICRKSDCRMRLGLLESISARKAQGDARVYGRISRVHFQLGKRKLNRPVV